MFARVEAGIVVEYPVEDVRARFPDVSLPADLTKPSNMPEGYVYVQPVAPFHTLHDQNVVEQLPVRSGDTWVQTWGLEYASPDEVASRTAVQAASIRSQRDQLLARCDWTQLRDSPEYPAYEAYRQALRDVPAQSGFPWRVEWPDV